MNVLARVTPEDVHKVADDQDSWTPGMLVPEWLLQKLNWIK